MPILIQNHRIFALAIVPNNKLSLNFMDCIRISFLRDGKELRWFTNYDLETVRELISLIGSQPYTENMNSFMNSLSDLFKNV